MQGFLRILFFLCIAWVSVCPALAESAGTIEIEQVKVERAENASHVLTAACSLELNSSLEEALQRGIPLYFTLELEVSRPRWMWFDEKPVSSSRTMRISYNVLTHQYGVGIVGGLQQYVISLEEALNRIRRPPAWVIAGKDVLKTGETYFAEIRIALDLSYLPKPFQVNVINNRHWQLSSHWKHFSFGA
ncbi:MAG: DUF4390 domain-containing protein [Burkholderiaceae bacterium]|jgi:hypothetical protein|nr:DUF4390 domain-containing protein [Burkholderiaceae bacterium]